MHFANRGRTDHFSSRAPGAAQHECCEPGPSYFAWGCFRYFVSGPCGAPPHSVSKTRVNSLMGRCAASGIRDRWCFALTANRFNPNPSCFSAAVAAARIPACPRGSHERAACRLCRSPSAERRTVSVRPACRPPAPLRVRHAGASLRLHQRLAFGLVPHRSTMASACQFHGFPLPGKQVENAASIHAGLAIRRPQSAALVPAANERRTLARRSGVSPGSAKVASRSWIRGS